MKKLLCLTVLLAPVASADEPKALDPKLAAAAGQSIDRCLAYLKGVQNPDGSFAEGENGPAITGLVVAGALRTKRVTPADPVIERALKYLEMHVQPDGGVYAKGGQRTYPTSICLLAFAEANKNKRYQKIVDGAVAFLKNDQWDEGENVTPESPKYGGAGYGRKSRPDLSNTAFMLEALDAAGLPKDDPAYQRALVFIRRCQNLSGEGANDLPQGQLVKDGGFYYTAAEDYNPGGGSVQAGLRSYGSMTYAGLKSFIHAGLKKDDFRVQAAMNWIKENYTLAENPGLGASGLFYYYHTFAKAMDVLEVDVFQDAKGAKHNWRAELVQKLIDRQKPDGSWENTDKRWFENDPRLVSAYVLLAYGHALE